jgi:DNA mismatch repair protein MutS2
VLEFDKLLERIAAEARSPGGGRRVRALLPEVEPAAVQRRQELVAEIGAAHDAGIASWPFDEIHDLRPLLRVAERDGACLSGIELRQVAATMHTATRMRYFLERNAEALARVREHANDLGEHTDLVREIHAAILESGEVADEASPALRKVRRGLVTQRQSILRRLEKHLGAQRGTDAYVTVRAERYVIPVRTDAGDVRGIVHDRSGSGATLFVEPFDVVDANNELQSLRNAEQREVRRILEGWTRRLAAEAEEIRRSLEALEELDALHAAARAGASMRAVRPEIGPTLRLRQARHPLLEMQLQELEQEIVPLDLDLSGVQALVITGPNTGGKTVALKTLGLLVLMHQAGLPVPAHVDSELPLFSRVVTDIGDEQSIEAAESTFSSHLRHVRTALSDARPGTLALLDEFMAGTDPQDGAALAKVVLRRLVRQQATTLVTTHLGELKLFAHAEPGLANASMLFDTDSRQPLFRLQSGVPGSSNALATAERLGFDPTLLEEARGERGDDVGRVESILQALEQERRRLAEARQTAEAERREAHRLREENAVAHAELSKRRDTVLRDARRELADLVSDARARVERTIRELRESQASHRAIRDARQELESLGAELQAMTPATPPAAAPTRAAQPGDTVWIRALAREGTLESVLSDGRARVRYGSAEVMVHVRDLEVRAGAEAAPAAPKTPLGGHEVIADDADTLLELDVRGLDREGALAAVDQFLDRALLEGSPLARIVHGKGTGVLRQSIQKHLASHPNVAEFRLGEHGEGGSGVTIVKLH